MGALQGTEGLDDFCLAFSLVGWQLEKRNRLDISGWRFEPSAQLMTSQYKRNITSVARLPFKG